MSMLGGITAGLAFLPHWLSDSKGAQPLDNLLSAWVRASSWKSAGIVWPAEAAPSVALLAKAEGTEQLLQPPAEMPEVVTALQSGTYTVVWRVPNSSGRLYCALAPAGRSAGLLWAERSMGEQWSELDRNYLRLSARLIERSPALLGQIGPSVDTDQLQQRLADASLIAGRMAHDFDNILTGIIGFADLSLPLIPAGSQPARFVAEIGKVGQRGISFTQQLHQLSRSGQCKPQAGSIGSVVAKELTRLKPAIQPNVQIFSEFPTSAGLVAMEATPLASVLGHLLENAVEATPAQGRILISSRVVELSESDAKSYLGAAGAGTHVEVTIRDSGPGIKPEVRARLFVEPLYTTKVRHRGLGLAISYRTLCAHRGGIRLDNATPHESGTIARIVIPPAIHPVPTTNQPTIHSTAMRGS